MVTGIRPAVRPVVPTNLRAVRVARLANEIAPTLEHATVIAEVDAIASVDEWRAAARKAGRARRWRIATGVVPDGGRVWAVRTDREVTPAELAAAVRSLDYLAASVRPTAAAPRR